MNYVKKLNLHWFCTQNHILEPFSVRRACTKSYVTSEPYPRASQSWCQNVRETWKKKVIKCRGESFARCRVITRNVEGAGLLGPPPPPPRLFRVNATSKMDQILSHHSGIQINLSLHPSAVCICVIPLIVKYAKFTLKCV